MPTIETHSFRTLTEAEEFIDKKIDESFDIAEHEGLWGLFCLDHDQEAKSFRLMFNEPAFPSYTARYEVDNTKEWC